MAANVDITFDVNTDVDTRRVYILSLGGAVPEGETCGALFIGEEGADGYVGVNVYGADDATELVLGDDVATGESSLWDNGAVVLTSSDTVAYALSEINKKLALASSAADLAAIESELQALSDSIAALPADAAEQLLGDEIGTDDSSLWDVGLVTLDASNSTAYAISLLNAALVTLQDAIDGMSSGPESGFFLQLGDVANDGDGSWSPGAVTLTDTTSVSSAVDSLNEVLAKLLPTAPPDFPNGTLAISNSSGSSPRFANGATDNTGDSYYAGGDAVTRITASGVSSNTFNDVGPGDSGTLAILLNGAVVDSHVLTGSGDAGNYTGLVISDQKDYPVETPGFWISVDVALSSLAASIGANKVQITHTAAGDTNVVYFVRDSLTSTPVVSSGSVVQAAAGTLAYSSGVPHYGTGAQLTVGCSISNLAGQTYYGGSDPLVISGTNSIISSDTKTYANLGITTPIDANTTTATAIDAQTVDIDGSNVHNSGVIQANAKNVNGSSGATTLSSTVILVKRGSAGSRIDENSITVSGLGSTPNNNNAVRKGSGSGDTPAGSGSSWDSTASIQTYDATVVAGVLKHDQTNYSSGYLPAGPDLSSGRSGAQYVTLSFNRAARSAFKIVVTGSYAGCWIKLPGVSDDNGVSPNAANGWWNAFQPYDGAGVPGEAGDSLAGCALGTVMSGGSGTFQITFGTASSTSATGNEIQVRFKLTAGQQITALSFTS